MGVPQGSVLGPLLFLVYINDLPQTTKHKCILFADDISVNIVCKNNKELENEVNNTIASIIQWMNNNNLYVNISKTTTNYLQFSNVKRKKKR